MKQPARMEFWGDEIDTMHTFDLATQRRDEPIEKIYVSPAREILFGQPADAAEKIRSYIKKARGRLALRWRPAPLRTWHSWTAARCPSTWTNISRCAIPSLRRF